MWKVFAISTLMILAAHSASAQSPNLVADFNGDGIDDLAVGAPFAGGPGSVSVFFGAAGTGFGTTSKTPDLVRSGRSSGELYGFALAAADFNRDGRFELVVGAPNWNGVRGRIEVLRFIQTAEFLYASPTSYTQGSPPVLDPSEPGDGFGMALTTGDFDGNGYPDLAVGIPGQDVVGMTDAGAVQIFRATSAGIITQGKQFWTQRSVGIQDEPQPGERFGSALASADFNGDGIDDLAVGVPSQDLTYIDQGAVHVIYGTFAGLSSQRSQFLTNAEGAEFVRATMGTSLAAGDINGDGIADLAIGAPGWLDTVGVVAIAYGSSAGLGRRFMNSQTLGGLASDDWLGGSLTVADFNGDGFADVAAGSAGKDVSGMQDAGAVTVFYGQAGFALTFQQFWHQNSYGVQDRIDPGDRFGMSLASGDFNGDGFADLAIGSALEDAGSSVNQGTVNVITGAATGLDAGADVLLVPVAREPGGFFGWSLSR
jgi:hypothetical protein